MFEIIDYIPDIILKPDYIGVNPNEQGLSVELIKKYADNVLIGIKLDAEEEYLYVSTMHDVQEIKISRRLHSGRIKVFSVDDEEREIVYYKWKKNMIVISIIIFEVGNGSRHTLKRVPEMMDTPPIQK